MARQHTTGRWMLVAAMTLAVVVVAGGFYLLAQLSQREAYFEARNFRALNEVAKQLEANLEHPFGVITADCSRQERLKTTAFYRDAEFVNEECRSKENSGGNTGGQDKDRISVVEQRAFRWFGQTDDVPPYVTIGFDRLIDPAVALRHFQSIAISRGDGTVLFQSGGRTPTDAARRGASDFLEFSRLKLEAQGVGATRHPVPGLQDNTGEPVPLLSFAGSSVVPVTVGGTDYLVFAIPFRPPVIPAEGGTLNVEKGWEEWVITGVVDARAFKRAHWEVRQGYAAIFFVLLLLGLFAWPFIKLRFRGSAESFRAGSLYFLFLSGLLGGILLVEGVAVTQLYFSTKNRFDDASRGLAGEIRDRLTAEVRTAAAVYDLQAPQMLNSGLSAFNDPDGFAATLKNFLDPTQETKPTEIEYTPTGTIALDESSRTSVAPMSTFFLDGRGRLCGNFLSTVVGQEIPPGLPLHKRAYYREIVHGGKWRTGSGTPAPEPGDSDLEEVLLTKTPFVDSVRSITTNELESVVSFPAVGQRECVIGFDEDADRPEHSTEYSPEDVSVFGMLLYFSTVEKAVLPLGFRFAVVNRESGKVLYHSDDDRRDRENFFVAAEDRGDLLARMDAGVPGPVSFFYDSADNAGYVEPLGGDSRMVGAGDQHADDLMREIPLSVVVFYDKGLVDLFTIQVGAKAYAMLAAFALWTALSAFVWQMLARAVRLRPWAFIWPRALPRTPWATIGGVVILVLFAVYVMMSDHLLKWVFALGLLPLLMFAWLFGCGLHDSRRGNGGRSEAGGRNVRRIWQSAVEWLGASPDRRYWTRSLLLLSAFILVPSVLVLRDLRDYQAYRYLYHANATLKSAETDRKRALFSMTDALCFPGEVKSQNNDLEENNSEENNSGENKSEENESQESICSRENQKALGTRTAQREELADEIADNGVYGRDEIANNGAYGRDWVEQAGACMWWEGGLWQAQAKFFPALEDLDRLVRINTGTPDGELKCINDPTSSSTDTLYTSASVVPGQLAALAALCAVALLLIGYFTKVVGSRLFGLDILGAPQDLPPVPLCPGARRHMLIRVPDRLKGEEARRQDSLDKIVRRILTENGIERLRGDQEPILDLSLSTERLQRWRERRTGWLANGYCRIRGFEPPLEDTERRGLLLEIFEDLRRDENLVLILEVPVSPLFKLIQPGAYPRCEADVDTAPSSDECHRWSLVFANFEKYYGRLPASPPPAIGKMDDVKQTIERECGAFFGLEDIKKTLTRVDDKTGKDWLSTLSPDHTEHEKRTIVVRAIKDHARGDYRRMWDECTTAERVLLYSMTSGDCAHPTHPATEHLMRRGLIRFDPVLRIANESFALFVRGAEDPRRIKKWRTQISSSAWFYVRVPLLITLGIFGFFVFSYFGDVANVVAAGIPSTIAAISVIARLFARRNLAA